MKKIQMFVVLFCVLLGAVLSKRLLHKRQHAYTIALLQTASHPALDAVQKGFLQGLEEYMPHQVAVRLYNAQGSVAQAHSIAQQLHADDSVDALFAIATPAVQAVTAVEKIKPVVIAAVTDPSALGIMHAETNVTGTNDMIDITAAVDLIQELLPTAKTVGLLFTAGEINAQIAAVSMRKDLESRGLQVTDYVASNEMDIPVLVERACRQADLLLSPTDNTVAASIHLIAEITQRTHTPFFVSDGMLVEAGALAARGVDYYQAGKQSAFIAHKVLVDGIRPYALPIQQPACDTIVINKRILSQLGLSVPKKLTAHVTFVG